MVNTIKNSLSVDEKTYQNYFYSKLVDEKLLSIDRNTDGYIPGTIFEHKLNVMSYGQSKALSQVLIYLTRFNRDGIPIPKNIMLVSQEESKGYLYNSEDYIEILNDIPKYATLKASKGIDGFKEKKNPTIIKYNLENFHKSKDLVNILGEKAEFTKVDINEHNAYGWATYFYKNAKKPKKIEFFKEIRNPMNELKNFINQWNGNEEDFKLIMDLLNDPIQQKRLGAFYTPPIYAKKAVELVREAIQKVPKENDYIILDRCAGTGALEAELTEEELSHVIVSTYELKEWHALKDRLGGLVRLIIPPIPKEIEKYPEYDEKTGFLSGANALEESFINRSDIMKYVKDDKCNIILLENPPYVDDSGSTTKSGKSRGLSKGNYVAEQMNKEIKSNFKGLVQSKDILNLFIWSGFKYYLTKPSDSYILFAPIKYWKIGHLVNKKFIKGFAFNRAYFHASKSMISCILWQNEQMDLEEFELEAFDIRSDKLISVKKINIKKIHKAVSEYLFDKEKDSTDSHDGIYSQRNGKEGTEIRSTATKNIYNHNIIGWLHFIGFAFDSKNLDLTRNTLNLRKNGFYLRKHNFLKKLPLFCAKAYPQENWYETDVYSTCADGGRIFEKDNDFLKKCLIYTCLSTKNRCRSLKGTDGRLYLNELCFDGNETMAALKLQKLLNIEGVNLTEIEKELLEDNKNLIDEIKKKDMSGNQVYDEYNKEFRYGLYQIDKEINIEMVIGKNKLGNDIKSAKYGDLRNMIVRYKKRIKEYYSCNIISDLIKYELLK